jgi:segregation and condensation protein B
MEAVTKDVVETVEVVSAAGQEQPSAAESVAAAVAPASKTPRKRKVVVPVVPDLAAKLEAILMSSDRAIPGKRIAPAVGLVKPLEEDAQDEIPEIPQEAEDAIAAAVVELNNSYAATGRTFRIEAVSGGYRILTTAEFAPVVHAFKKVGTNTKLSRAAIETLAIIAFRQPMTRAELEAIRGVSCGEVLRSLLERRLITIKGRAEELGRPLLYGTTKQFLDHFGLASLKDLPTVDDLKAGG